MPLFMIKAKYSDDSLKAMVLKPSDRSLALSRAVSAHGGNLHMFYWAFGDFDAVAVFDAPSNQAAKSVEMMLAASGAVSSQEMRAVITNHQAMEAMRRAQSVDTEFKTPRQEWEGWRDYGGEAG
ncbi:MAG: GYD domain-containing protein [Rhodospirillales bacterium]|jgi:uncharacterized protein with GYD domain|nr:GYD domain-containing protein [Rhodospirillales bacterium]